jgi:large subunit ribosomal protein L25
MAAKIAEHTLKAEKREIFGRKIKQLRRAGVLPSNVYGRDIKSFAVQVNLKDFEKLYEEVGETGLIALSVDGTDHPVLVHEIHRHPLNGSPLHVDFHEVDLKEKVRATVQIEFEGEAAAEKEGVGVVVPQMREIEVEALPTDLPENIIVDISVLAEVDQAIHVKDLKIDRSKVELMEEDPERIVVSVAAPQKEEEPEPEAVEGAEGETPAEGSEAPAEGGEESKEEKASE